MFDKDESFYPGGENYGPQEPSAPTMGDMASGIASGAGYYATSAADSGKETLKKAMPLIKIAVVLLIIIFGVAYWLGLNQTINFTIKGVDSPSIDGSKLVIYGSDTKPIYSKTASTHTIQLQPGTYTVKASAEGYNSESYNLSIPNEVDGTRVNDVPIVLKKKISATLEIQLDETAIYPKQTLNGTLVITNKGTEAISDEEIISKDSEGLDIVFTPKVFSVSAGGATSISFTINQKTPVVKQKDVTPKISIKDTTVLDSIKLSLMPEIIPKEVSYAGDIKSGKIEKTNLKAGTQVNITISIKNSNKTMPIENVLLTVMPQESLYDSKISWFEFAEYTGEKNTQLVAKINPGATETITLRVKPPIDTTIADGEFYGLVSITSLSLAEDQNFPIFVKVATENKVGLVLTPSSLTITCHKNTGTCDPLSVSKIGSLKNNGTVDITSISKIEISTEKSSPECTWLTITPPTIPSLKQSDPAENIYAQITSGATQETKFVCYLKWEFPDPLVTGEKVVEVSDPIEIKVNQSAN